jgi:predicted DNA-binding transcriptional regulator AlpA
MTAGVDTRLERSRLLDAKSVAALLSLSTRTVWRMGAAGELPKPVRLSERVVRWRLVDIEAYIRGHQDKG